MNFAESKPMICNLSPISIFPPSNKNHHKLFPFSLMNYNLFLPFSSSWLILSQVFSESKESSSSMFIYVAISFIRLILMLRMFFVTFQVNGHFNSEFSALFTCDSYTVIHFIPLTSMIRTFIVLLLKLVFFICSFGSLKVQVSWLK